MLLAQHNYSFYYIWFRQKCKPCDIPISNHFSHQRLQSICCVSQQSLESATSVYGDAELQLKRLFLLSRFMAAFFCTLSDRWNYRGNFAVQLFAIFRKNFITFEIAIKWNDNILWGTFAFLVLCFANWKKKRDEKKEIKSGNMTK